MKRLIKKNNITIPLINEEIKLTNDHKYENFDMNLMSNPENRDGAVLVDVKNKKLYMGFNGETHAKLMEQYYQIPQNSNESRHKTDDYVVPGVYLKNFLGQETIILYSYLNGAEEVIIQEKPGIVVYEEDYWNESLIRIAKKES